ncbi:MAG: hypothetical protein IIZ09_06710 [Ruminococcus sp.]|nr:hypothetical protein [Ruminococcus sp.]
MSWREVKTQADIDEFMEKNGDLHDSVIVSVNYVSGCHDTDGSYMIVSSPDNALLLTVDSGWFGRIEMLFSGVVYHAVQGHAENYSAEIHECVLEFRTDLMGNTRDDRLIVWTDGTRLKSLEKFGIDLKAANDSFVIAKSLRWRYAKEADDMDIEDEVYKHFI